MTRFLFVPMAALTIAAMGLLATPARADMTVTTHLYGPAIRGVRSIGLAAYQVQIDPETGAVSRELDVDVERVNVPNGTALTVFVNSTAVGMIAVHFREGSLTLSTDLGHAVPVMHKGDMVMVKLASGAVVMSGAF